MFKKIKEFTYEHVDSADHPEKEDRNTSVAEYFRKYSAGRSDLMPQDNRPEVTDDRSSDEMLDDDSKINHMSCDELDALMEMQENQQKFEDALKEIELTKAQRQQFDDAVAILNNANSSTDQKREAYEMLEELHEKVTRARKT